MATVKKGANLVGLTVDVGPPQRPEDGEDGRHQAVDEGLISPHEKGWPRRVGDTDDANAFAVLEAIVRSLGIRRVEYLAPCVLVVHAQKSSVSALLAHATWWGETTGRASRACR